MIECLSPFISFAISLVALFLLLQSRLANLALDRPNHRSLHKGTIPRTGGLAVMAGVVIVWCLITQEWVWLGLLVFLTIVSFIDDIRGLPISWRLLAQLLACTALVLVDTPNLAWWALAVAVLAMVWMINLYNFMDGIDGLAGGMTLFGFGFYGLAAYLTGDIHFAVMSACIAAAALAFLLFNFHPARIFMGDAGSVPLGFLAASMGLHGWQGGLWPAWFPVLVFSPFVVDSTVTLLKRLLRGEKVWQAHKSHYYQRLVQMGWGHRKTALIEYMLMFTVGSSAVLLLQKTMPLVLGALVFWVILYGLLIGAIDQRWSVRKRSNDAF